MPEYFENVKGLVQELSLKVTQEDQVEELLIVDDEENGIKNLIIDCEDPILILEQKILPLSDQAQKNAPILMRLLQMNRNMVHGAFVISEDGKTLIFRDTLQLANLDLNELEGSVNALSLALAEYGEELLSFSRV